MTRRWTRHLFDDCSHKTKRTRSGLAHFERTCGFCEARQTNPFWSRAVDVDGCWVWTGARTPKGYGNARHNGRTRLSHRVAWELARGPIPEGLFVCHRCDNPPCVNPAHLFLGTALDNIRDSSAKGRMHPGERHGMAKLTDAIVRDIRSRYAAGQTQRSIAEHYGVHLNTVYRVCAGKQWTHVA